jgi:hypothetical protein
MVDGATGEDIDEIVRETLRRRSHWRIRLGG